METVTMVYTEPTDNLAIDPPLEANDAPLMGNPVLARRAVPRRANNTAWYVGVPLALVAVCGAAYVVVSGHQSAPLVTNSGATSQTTAQASTAPVAPTATPSPVATPAPAPLAQVTPEPAMAPVQPPARLVREARVDMRAAHRAEHRAAAAAEDTGADASATAPVTAPPAPVEAAPAPAPAAPQVITPPPPAH
jgi:hypothetical protein